MTASISDAGESWLKCHACEYKRPLKWAVKELSSKTVGGRYAKVSAWVEKNEGRDMSADVDWKEDLHDYREEAQALTKHPLPGEALAFLASKGITSPACIKQFVLWEPTEKAVVIPTFGFRRGRLVIMGGAARRLKKRKGKKKESKYWTMWEYEPYFHLYGEQRLREWSGKRVLLVEGQFDAIHCWQHGVPAVALMGVHFSKPKGELLQLAGIQEAVLMLDDEVYSTEHRKTMVIDATVQALRNMGIAAWDERNEKDPKHLDAKTLQDIIKKPRIKDLS